MTLRKLLKAPLALILFFTALLAISTAMIPQLEVQLFPPVDRDQYVIDVEVNEEKANLVGITNYDIASTVRMVVNGLEISELKEADIEKDSIPIVIKISEEQKKSRDILDSVFMTSQITGENIPISQIAEIKTESSMNKIVRRDSKRTITIGMFVENGYSSNKALKACEELIKDYRLPEGYTIEFGGESEDRNDAFRSMKLPAVLAVLIIYLFNDTAYITY